MEIDRYTIEKRTDSRKVRSELEVYLKNAFTRPQLSLASFPFQDEAFAQFWSEILLEFPDKKAFTILKEHLIALQFPIAEGMSSTEAYIRAKQRGIGPVSDGDERGLQLRDPEGVQLFMYTSLAGKVPVVIVPNDEDFKDLLRAICYKNEPVQVPDAMGASFINGIPNWTRIRQLKDQWLSNHPGGNWPRAFKEEIVPNRYLYQDKFMLLSTKEYSNIPASSLGIPSLEWRKKSLDIRLEHECAHYFTLRYFGKMSKNMHDELLADYMGITHVQKTFRSDWFLHFLGLEDYPNYRKGGRLENYLGSSNWSKEARMELYKIMRNAALQVERFDYMLGEPVSTKDRLLRLLSLAAFPLDEIGSETGAQKLSLFYQNQEKEHAYV